MFKSYEEQNEKSTKAHFFKSSKIRLVMAQQTPYFLFKPKILTQNYLEFENLCKKHLNNYKICYSVKTNSFPGTIKTLAKQGSGFEVASLNEIRATPTTLKVFNSPCKTPEELKIAIKKRFLINADSKSEIDKIYNITKGKPFEIGLRISFKDSKFGFNEKLIINIIDYCLSKNLSIAGVHFHAGTQMNLSEYKANLEKLSILVYFLEKKGFKLKYIDIGGGFPDKIQLRNLNLKLEDYFLAIKNLNKFNSIIILEPGRNLVCDAFELIAKIHVIKENFGKTYAILDAGINFLPKITFSTYRFSRLNKDENAEKKEYILAGPLLFSNDVFGRFFKSLNEGDLIRIENVGAYCYNLAWEISYKKPKIVVEKD
jgi:diaminopimelate decarboxylase